MKRFCTPKPVPVGFEQREIVRHWLQTQPDIALRQAVYALQLLYDPVHIVVLLGMALRAGYTRAPLTMTLH